MLHCWVTVYFEASDFGDFFRGIAVCSDINSTLEGSRKFLSIKNARK